jgi:hypothetical protein
MCLIVGTSFFVWVGGIKLQWRLGLRDLRQMIVMLVLLPLPALIAPPFARVVAAALLPDAALLSSRAGLWFGVALLLIWACVGALLMLGVDEGLGAKLALAALFLGAFVSTYAQSPTALKPTASPAVGVR